MPGTGQVTCTQKGQAFVTQGTTRNSCCSPCPRGARKVIHCMWSAFIFYGQVKSTICPCEIPIGAGSRILPLVLYPGFNKMSVVACSCLGAVARCRTASTGATPSLRGFSLRTHKTSHRCRAYPFKEVIFAAFTAHPHDSKCFISCGAYCSKSVRESEISSTSYDTDYYIPPYREPSNFQK